MRVPQELSAANRGGGRVSATRVALVTGSAKGIGSAIASRLAADGLVVDGVDVLARESWEDSGVTTALVSDLADPSGCAAVLDAVERIDVLVNNAGILIDAPFEKADIADLDRQYAINLRAPILLARACAPAMASRGWGRIVNVSSVGVHTGGMSAGSAFYAATKSGLHALTRHVARVYGRAGVTSNAVAPGWVRTDMGRISQAAGATIPDNHPVGREAEADEIAAVVAFLARDEARYVNGTIVDVNGGWLMR